ncbi:hypothetical protein IAG44_13495 [Streptomyces roseirectus]|uniref:DUF5709 domain-containing protein n=1 Tax=Streptomyces roseirectus TaxID=2768066 RepID=A0A7H0IC45_9ACTN|nr:hypothetical protein [Streptomyces roseirectus]QNP70361.1 hypothetical protein IAG44_13495 [Streptomyces roseirectus]
MAIDPTDPDSFEHGGQVDVEAPENDTAEQRADLSPDGDDPLEDVDPARADEAAEADLLEQSRVVSLDEDDYR